MSTKPPVNDSATRDYEDKDIRLRALVLFFIITGAVTLLALVGMGLLFQHFARSATRADRPWSEFAAERQLPPPPLLQVEPPKELAVHRAEEDALLTRYEWVDRQAGTVRIPVDRAIDLLVARGLPVRGDAPRTEPAAAGEEQP